MSSITVYAQAPDIAGTVELVDGEVWVQGKNNKIRPIKKDQSLYNGDIIITGKDGELQARMQDEAIIAVRANSRLKIESYRAKGDNEDEAVFSLIRGTFRSITGWIGKYNRKKYAIKTSIATIGVRGTDHEPMYIPPPVPGMKPLGEPGLYDKVNSGRVVMMNKFGETEFGKNQAGFIPLDAKKAAVRLSGIPEFFKNSRHEKRIIKSKKQLLNRIDNQLIKRQQQLKPIRKKDTQEKRSLPQLLKAVPTLKPAPTKGGFTPGSKPANPVKQMPGNIKQPEFKRPIKPLTPIVQPQVRKPLTRALPTTKQPLVVPQKIIKNNTPVIEKQVSDSKEKESLQPEKTIQKPGLPSSQGTSLPVLTRPTLQADTNLKKPITNDANIKILQKAASPTLIQPTIKTPAAPSPLPLPYPNLRK